MTDPAIRAALDAAGEAAMQDLGWDDLGEYGPSLRAAASDAAAAAVAAFLRALPMPENNSGGWACHLVADAVERAAGGEG